MIVSHFTAFTTCINELMRCIPEDTEILHFGFHKYAVRDVFLPWDLSSLLEDDIGDTLIQQNLTSLHLLL